MPLPNRPLPLVSWNPWPLNVDCLSSCIFLSPHVTTQPIVEGGGIRLGRAMSICGSLLAMYWHVTHPRQVTGSGQSSRAALRYSPMVKNLGQVAHHGFGGSLLATCRSMYDLPTIECRVGSCTSGSMGFHSSCGAPILGRAYTSSVAFRPKTYLPHLLSRSV
jgi:hypothetical protein